MSVSSPGSVVGFNMPLNQLREEFRLLDIAQMRAAWQGTKLRARDGGRKFGAARRRCGGVVFP